MNSSWLANNWGWLVLAAIVVIVFIAYSRKGQSSTNRYRPGKSSSGGLNLNQEESAALNALVNVLEEIVDKVVGSTYSSGDKRKIAIGMVAVMASDNIKLETLANDSKLFAEVMVKSMAHLTKSGEIHAH
jgi:hypothetical protein